MKHSRAPDQDRKELFARIVFNIFVGNTDDHARNHACFWDGQSLELTPAYDLCPQPRHSHGAKQAMALGLHGRQSTLANAVSRCDRFGLSHDEAWEIIEHQRNTISDRVEGYLVQLGVSEHQVSRLVGTTFLSSSIDE